MFGKVIRLNDFKFTFGQETVYLNVFAVFKNKKSGNKYIIYSYDNKKLYSGSAFIKNNEIVVMISKSEEDDVIKDFTNKLAKVFSLPVKLSIFTNSIKSSISLFLLGISISYNIYFLFTFILIEKN